MATENEGRAAIAAHDWGRYQDEILDLFVIQEKTLREVMQIMRTKHGFDKTARQYKHRFTRLKNITEEEWVYISEERQRRAALGKGSVICLHGKPLPAARVTRGIARVQKKGSQHRAAKQSSKLPTTRISLRTPSPAPAAGESNALNQQPVAAIGFPPFASNNPQPVQGAQMPIGDLSSAGSVIAEGSSGWSGTVDVEIPHQWTGPAFRNMNIDAASGFESGTVTALNGRTTGYLPLDVMPVQPDNRAHSRMPSVEAHLLPFMSVESGFMVSGIQLGRGLLRNLPLFRVLSVVEQPGYSLPGRLPSRGVNPSMFPATTTSGFLIMAQSALLCSGCWSEELHRTFSVSEITPRLQHVLPERYQGDLSNQIARIADNSLPASHALPTLLTLAAFFASNNSLERSHMDGFLRWIITQGYEESLTRFMEIQSPTIHAFAKALLESALRIKNVPMLNTLLDCGIKLDSKLLAVAHIEDAPLTWRVLSNVDRAYLAGAVGATLLSCFISKRQFELAQFLLDTGVPADAPSYHNWPALYSAVLVKNIEGIEFLLKAGADVNKVVYQRPGHSVSPFGLAVYHGFTEAVLLFLEHGADVSTTIGGEPVCAWASLHCRHIYSLLKERSYPGAVGFLLGDLLDAANCGDRSLRAYIAKHPEEVTTHRLERALEESIKRNKLIAAVTLLQHGVSPDGPTLPTRPLVTALDQEKHSNNPVLAGLLLQYSADVQQPGVLETLALMRVPDLLQKALTPCIDLEQEGVKALVAAAGTNNVASVAALLRAGVEIDAPDTDLKFNALQNAAVGGYTGMILFLISEGANVNAPAYPVRGRTALQAALEVGDTGENVEVAEMLLHHGADASAPPALREGVTVLEAYCNRYYSLDDDPAFCEKLLNAGATVNRPDGKPSSAIHGVIEKKWHGVLRRFLQPQHNAIINHMWCDKSWDDDESTREPRTPTQLAASCKDLEALKMLLDHGADVNEAPAPRFGRSALQAAASLEPRPGKTALIHFLLDRGADVNADPAPEGGITALQGAAIAGDLMLAELLIDRGADVNAWPSFVNGRTAIEGAAEHGRLDMVQLLLNAGAKGDVASGRGFERAIELAKKEGHFAVVSILEAEQEHVERSRTRGPC